MARRRSKSTKASTPLSERFTSLKPILVAGTWTSVIVAVAFGLALGVPALRAEALALRPEGPMRVVFEDRPTWMTDGDLSPLAELVDRPLSGSPMDRAGLAAAREALLASGWFEEIRQVRRTGSDEVSIEATWATPFAVIREDGYDYLVDMRGRLLPRCYKAGTAPRGFLRIEGARQPRPTSYGTPWPGDDVSAAMALARLIDERPWRSQIAWVDLSGVPTDGCLRLKTTRNCTIKWGRAPGREGAAEVPARQKLEYLGWLQDHQGRIDASCEDQIDLLNDYVGVR
jgi:hypothetical protein